MPFDVDQQFPAPFDTATKVISCLACGVLLFGVGLSHSLIAGAVALLVIAGAYAYSPRSYSVGAQGVVVRRLIGDVTFPLDGLRVARLCTRDDLRGCIRLWGNGGLFGYYGLFRTSALGRCTWYVTDRKRAVVLITGGKTALFSPGDTEGFLAAVKTRSPGLADAPLELEGLAAGASRSAWLVPAAIVLVVLAIVSAALLYSPGEPGCALGRGALEIHDRFYPVTVYAADVDVGGIRIVDLDTESAWRPIMRTNGFGSLHYQSGWFRTAGGQTIRMYRAGGRRLVLLPPKGASAPVLIQAKDPEAFVAELRRAWKRQN